MQMQTRVIGTTIHMHIGNGVWRPAPANMAGELARLHYLERNAKLEVRKQPDAVLHSMLLQSVPTPRKRGITLAPRRPCTPGMVGGIVYCR